MFKAWTDACEQWLRSTPFLEATKQTFDAGADLRKQSHEFIDQFQREMRLAGRQDAEEVTLAVRRMERRVLDELDEVSGRLDVLSARLHAISARLDVYDDAGSESDTPRANHRKRKPHPDDRTEQPQP